MKIPSKTKARNMRILAIFPRQLQLQQYAKWNCSHFLAAATRRLFSIGKHRCCRRLLKFSNLLEVAWPFSLLKPRRLLKPGSLQPSASNSRIEERERKKLLWSRTGWRSNKEDRLCNTPLSGIKHYHTSPTQWWLETDVWDIWDSLLKK